MDPPSPFARHFGTNYVPDKAEIDDIKELISGRQVVVDGIDEEIAELDRRRKALLEKRQAEMVHIDNHRELISPARRLHPDVLSSIFLELVSTFKFCGHFRQPPAITLSQVCREWRDLALSSPLVWAYINIYVFGYPVRPIEPLVEDALEAYDRSLSQWATRLEGLCTMADVFAARSQGCPLHIAFAAEDPAVEDYADALSHEGGWCRVAEPLLRIRNKSRNEWKSITFDLTLTSAIPSLLEVVLAPPASKHKGLQRLKLDIAYKETRSDALTRMWEGLQGKIDIREAPLTSLTLLMPFVHMCRIHVRWDGLVSLAIGCSNPDGNVTFTPQDAINVLRITPNIVQCTIELSNDVHEAMRTPQQPVTLSKLQELNIRGPVLRTDFSTLLDTPSLLRLSVIHERGSPSNENRSAIVDWVRRYGGQLTHVALAYPSLTQSAFAYVLEHIPNVKSLELQGDDDNRLYNSSEAHAKGGGSSEELAVEECICAKLQTFICKLEDGHSEKTKVMVMDMVEARRKVGRKKGPVAWIEKVDVTFRAGPVDGMLEDLRGRGVETYGVTFKARYADARSTPCRFSQLVPGIGTFVMTVPNDHNHDAHGHDDGHSHC